MKLLKAIGLGIVFWVLIFVAVSVLMFGFKLSAPSINYYTILYLIVAIITIVLTLIYFSGKKKTRGGFLRGILVGIIFIIIGVILDALITVPFFIIPQGGSYMSYFLDSYLLIGFLVSIILSGIVGAVKK